MYPFSAAPDALHRVNTVHAHTDIETRREMVRILEAGALQAPPG